jgi:hypothetical protein
MATLAKTKTKKPRKNVTTSRSPAIATLASNPFHDAAENSKPVLNLTVAEAEGIRHGITNAEPLTAEAKATWETYFRFRADNPNSSW